MVLSFSALAHPALCQLTGNTGMVRNDQVLAWNSTHNGRFGLSPDFVLNLDSNLSTSLNMTTEKEDRWYDSVFNRAELLYAANRTTQVSVRALEDWNRDTFSRYGGSLLTSSLDASVRYRPAQSLSVVAGLGQLYDRRFENEDRGTTATGTVQYDTAPASRLRASASLDGSASNLTRTRNDYSFRGTLAYDGAPAFMSLEIRENFQDQGYFSDADRKLTEDRRRLERQAAITITRGNIRMPDNRLALLFTANIGTRRVQDTANDDPRSSKYMNDSDGSAGGFTIALARVFAGHMSALLESVYLRDNNRVDRALRSRDQTDVSLRSELGLGFAADSLTAVGWIKRSRIDTPKGVPNDRDELKFEGGIRYVRNFSSSLQTGLDFRVLETHYVNIDASQSTQNKWIKTYQFAPFLVYSPVSSMRFRHSVYISANHMDYDFDSAANPRSNITRRVSSESRIDANISPRTKLTVGFMIESNDYGNLDSRNRKLPVEEGIRRYGEIGVEYRFTDWLRVTPQYVYAIRRDTGVVGGELIRREIDQTFGFSGAMFENTTGDYTLRFSVKRIIRDTEAYPKRIRDYIDVMMSYGF